MADRGRERVEVVVVGAGQAGLAIGYHLARQGQTFVIFDRADSIGAAWRSRWDSLVLFTPRRYSGLPGLPFPGDPDGYPGRDEVIAYLEQYAATFELPIELDSAVRSLTSANGRFVVRLDDRQIEADQIVVATGPFQMPRVPALAGEPRAGGVSDAQHRIPEARGRPRGDGARGRRREYRLPDRKGARRNPYRSSRRGLAAEAAASKAPRPRPLLVADQDRSDREEHRFTVRTSGEPTGHPPRLESPPARTLGIELEPRATEASGRVVGFADGSQLEVDAVIWSTGYRPDHTWIELPVIDSEGRISHRRGVTDVPGLFFLGLSWQHTRGSALIGWVGDDARFIAEQIAARTEARIGAPSGHGPERDSQRASRNDVTEGA